MALPVDVPGEGRGGEGEVGGGLGVGFPLPSCVWSLDGRGRRVSGPGRPHPHRGARSGQDRTPGCGSCALSISEGCVCLAWLASGGGGVSAVLRPLGFPFVFCFLVSLVTLILSPCPFVRVHSLFPIFLCPFLSPPRSVPICSLRCRGDRWGHRRSHGPTLTPVANPPLASPTWPEGAVWPATWTAHRKRPRQGSPPRLGPLWAPHLCLNTSPPRQHGERARGFAASAGGAGPRGRGRRRR